MQIRAIGFSNVTTKFNALSDSKKLDFYYDFRNSESALAQLNADSDLIDSWSKVAYLRIHRKSIKYLKGYRFIVESMDSNMVKFKNHFFKGDINSSGTNSSGFHSIYGSLDENEYGKILQNLDQEFPPDPRGYYVAEVGVKNNDIPPQFIPKTFSYRDENNIKITKNIANDMFRRDWDEPEILENIVLAYTTKRYSGNGNIFLGQMSDGKILEICIGPRYGPNMGIIDDFISVPKTCWPKRYIKKNL